MFRYLRPFALTGNWHYSYANPSWSYFDTAPGSSERTVADAHDQSGSLAIDWPTNTFMATVSSLDIQDAGSYNSPNLGYNVQQQIPFSNLPNRAKYAFDAYFSANNVNEPHVQITNGQPTAYNYNTSYYTDNSTWIQNELRQSAHLMPAMLTTTYNYGSPYRHLLPSVQVNGGGQLYFNNGGLPVSGGTAATQGAPPQGNFEVYTSNCPTVVQVNSGGQVSVGVSASYTAALQISANSLLDLRTGGQTTVNAGSVLHIAAGGTLVVRQGTTLTVAGQLIVDAGAYLCLENGQSIATTGAGQVSISSSAYRYANPALGLSGLSCQPGTCPSSVRLAAQCRPVTAPGGCSTTSVVTASGSSLGVDFRWTVDGSAVASANGQATISVFTSQSANRHTVSVQVSSTCPGGSPVTASAVVGCSFPDCGPRPHGAVAMYPNPAASSVDFSTQPDNATPASKAAMTSTATSEPTEYEVSLYDGQGALRWHGSSRAGRLRLDSSNLPRGLYGVVITQGETISRQNLSLE